MDGNFTIGRFGGIEVRLHWSLIAVFALIVWSLADGVLPSENPGLSDGTYLATGIVAALLFLASILLHELGHSWVARHEGIEVDSITLWLFGGVAEFKDRFASAGRRVPSRLLPGRSSRSCLGVVFVLIALAGLPSAVDGAAAWLGYINLILAAFNLFPRRRWTAAACCTPPSGEPRRITPGRRVSRQRSARASATCSSRSAS